MIPGRYEKLVQPLIMSLLMSCIMSFVVTVFNVGLVEEIITIWLKSWSLAFVVAFPTIIAITPAVKKIVTILVSQKTA